MLARRHTHFIFVVSLLAAALSVAMWLNASRADGETRGFERANGVIALTFDDGPDPRFTPAVLDVLKAHNEHATFFVVGNQAAKHPEIVARILAEGHEIAHHTQTHPHVEQLGEGELAAEVDACLDTLAEQGVTPRWYRPPRGKLTEYQGRLARARGMKVAMWARALERSHIPTAEQLAATLAAETLPGDIVLAHDGGADRSMTVAALPLYLAALKARGVASVTMSELENASSGSR